MMNVTTTAKFPFFHLELNDWRTALTALDNCEFRW